jgi:hypothetical protein
MPDTQRQPSAWLYVTLFALIAAALVGAGWHMVHAATYEVGDFAANSLLIQDAKHLQLIYGNYSRVGFNHPGPAILYVLAAGELVFHDWLHLVAAPFGGQLLASLLYNAAWMVLIFSIVRRMAGTLQALLFVGVVALVVACIDPAIVNGMWFPHLYFFPFAALLVSIAPLAYGRTHTLKALAVSTGFLINGHASFIPMLGIMLVVMLCANTLVSRHDPSVRMLSRAWLRRHRRALLVACAILGVFLLPLLIATVKDFPGPLFDYVKFGRGNKGNHFRDALAFVAGYWGSGQALAAGLLLALVLVVLLLKTPRVIQGEPAGQSGEMEFLRSARGLGFAFVAASLALLYYAKAGIDDLTQTYVAIFYYAVPAMSWGLVMLFACRALANGSREKAAGWLLLPVLAVTWNGVRHAPSYTYLYDHPGVADLYRQLRALPGSGRIVLDFDQDPRTWGIIWGSTLGLQAHARREHVDLVCVGRNWHISNTRPARCTAQELALNRRFEVLQTDAPDPQRGDPVVEAQGLSLYRTGAAPQPFSYFTAREHPDYFRQIMGKGWSHLEGDFAWTDGEFAELNLPAEPGRARMLVLDMGSFVPATDVVLRVHAIVDGKPAGYAEWRYSERRHRFPIDLGTDPGAAKRIELRIDTPVTPQQYHIGEDTRRIGLSLYAIKKEPA